MLKTVKRLFLLLTPDQRGRFYRLQVLVLIMVFGEILGVASIIPFMSLVGDINQLNQDTFISKVYKLTGFTSESKFIFFLGIAVLLTLLVSAILSMITLWRMSMFANKIGTEMADRLYSYYIRQDWLFHASGSSSQMTKEIANETTRVTTLVLTPLMHMNARIGLAIFMTLAIFIFDPKVALIGILIFATGYFFLYKFVRFRLQRNGEVISNVLERRFRLMNEGFGGIKDILLLGRDANFIRLFNKSGNELAYSQGTNTALSQVPRYLMELVAFGSMIGLILYLLAFYEGNLGLILPQLSAYALASIKLLPAFQQIYLNFALLKGNISAFEAIEKDLESSFSHCEKPTYQKGKYLNLKSNISLENVTFTYPEKNKPAIEKLSISIHRNQIIGLVGPSGSGKSTLIDILLGLITPQIGSLKVDGNIIDSNNLRSWQNTIGFVPQTIFLSEGSIAENIAFGIPSDEIDYDSVNKAIHMSHLEEAINMLDKGIHTTVGERGIQLSGGQRQRIGIARALYHRADILVFDEATSSLDGITEKLIMDAIHDFSGLKTIIIVAHRLRTVEKCDQIFFLDKGSIIDNGSFNDLIKRNERFKNMASHA